MTGDDHSHPLFAAIYDPVTWVAERTLFPRHRRYLARDLHGRVLSVGVGTGPSFPYLKDAAEHDPDLELHGIDPDPHMRRRAERRARDLDLAIDLRGDPAEDLPYEDDSFDVVIAALVFCTIPDVDRAMDEVARVLRPGGEFRFFEHVRADGRLAGVQSAINPAWRVAAAGCNLDRDTEARFRGDDRFEVVEIERFDGVPPVSPLIRGRLRRRDESE